MAAIGNVQHETDSLVYRWGLVSHVQQRGLAESTREGRDNVAALLPESLPTLSCPC
jgi:hypothetical protein